MSSEQNEKVHLTGVIVLDELDDGKITLFAEDTDAQMYVHTVYTKKWDDVKKSRFDDPETEKKAEAFLIELGLSGIFETVSNEFVEHQFEAYVFEDSSGQLRFTMSKPMPRFDKLVATDRKFFEKNSEPYKLVGWADSPVRYDERSGTSWGGRINIGVEVPVLDDKGKPTSDMRIVRISGLITYDDETAKEIRIKTKYADDSVLKQHASYYRDHADEPDVLERNISNLDRVISVKRNALLNQMSATFNFDATAAFAGDDVEVYVLPTFRSFGETIYLDGEVQ